MTRASQWSEKSVRYSSLIGLMLSLVMFHSALAQPGSSYAAWEERLAPWSERGRPRQRRRCQRLCQGLVRRRLWVLGCRLSLVAALLLWSGWGQHQRGSWLLLGLPILGSIWPLLGLSWPAIGQRKSYGYLGRMIEAGYVVLVGVLGCQGLLEATGGPRAWQFMIGPGLKLAEGGQAQGWQEGDGTWRVELQGHFSISYRPHNEFEKRVLLHFLRQIKRPDSQRPFLRQTWLAEWFETRQELISRWEKYVRDGGLEKLHGQAERWVLSEPIAQAILAIWVPNFWLSATQVQQQLVAEGQIGSADELPVGNIHRLAQETGLAEIRRQLRPLLRFDAEGPSWRDEVLVKRLLALNDRLLSRLEELGGLTPQLTLAGTALKEGLATAPPVWKKSLPLAYQWQHTLFGHWQACPDEGVRCPHCGSSWVDRKENTPRRKKYHDPQTGQWQEVTGYRYYCRNPACAYGSFTDYPPGVRLYSCWRVETVLRGVALLMHTRTTYRRAADVVGVSHVTLWRWAMLIGQHSLPLAALFGLVRCSGVVGVDEKWVLLPKNDKPAGKRQRWMYVYLAVDVHTYDLLHIDIFPYNGQDQARAFLQALKAQGYQPQVIVTDMNQDYAEPIRQVFPQAKHHECVFHALQWVQRLIKEVYGPDYAQTHPQAQDLKEQIYTIFQAKSRKTVHKRYQAVMAQKALFVAHHPQAQRLFDFLERHYPTLTNAVEDPLTPLTNNAVELVIRRFDQHYQNMAGFDTLDTARAFLNLFALFYRFTPFAKDNRPVQGRSADFRGKCPLQLAGYDISHMPIAHILHAHLHGWPPEAIHHLVPNT